LPRLGVKAPKLAAVYFYALTFRPLNRIFTMNDENASL